MGLWLPLTFPLSPPSNKIKRKNTEMMRVSSTFPLKYLKKNISWNRKLREFSCCICCTKDSFFLCNKFPTHIFGNVDVRSGPPPTIQFVGKTKGTHTRVVLVLVILARLTGCLGAINGTTYYYQKIIFRINKSRYPPVN